MSDDHAAHPDAWHEPDAPATDGPGADTSGADTSGADTSGSAASGAETPGAEASGVEAPGGSPAPEPSGAGHPHADTPGAAEPGPSPADIPEPSGTGHRADAASPASPVAPAAPAPPASPASPVAPAAPAPPAAPVSSPGGVTPADAADAARLVAFGLQPKLIPARDADYADLLRRYREEPAFGRLADAVATGLGLIVLEVSPRAGMAVTAAEDSVFAVRMGDYARRASTDSADRFLHGLAHLAVAALAFPRPEDLADDGYIGRITVNGVDSFVRQACRRLEERAEEQGENTDPATGVPGLEAAWRVYARRSSTGATKDARRLAGSTTGIIGKAVAFLTDSGFLQRTGDESGGSYRTTARYQLQVRDMAGSAAMAELLELGVVPVSDGSATLLPPPEGDDLELAADAGLPFHAAPTP